MPNLYTAAQSKEIDARALAHLQLSGTSLMQRAADFAWQTLVEEFPSARRLLVWCGKGNNAGDAYLVAKHAHEFGLAVNVLSVVPVAQLSGDAAAAYQQAIGAGVAVQEWRADAAFSDSEPDSELSADVHIDGLLGTGIQGAPRPHVSAAITAMNGARTTHTNSAVFSVDLPSGVDASTGNIPGVAVRADVVVTFIAHKVASFTGPALDLLGKVHFADLGVDLRKLELTDIPPVASTCAFADWVDSPAPISRNTYKHRQGHVMVCGSDLGMPGAILMAARAAMRSGAGMVTCVTHAEHQASMTAHTPELMLTTPVDMHARAATLYVLGPGLGRSDWSQALYNEVQAHSARTETPVVLDADGLYWLAQRGEWLGGPLVITPHIAEAARLLSCSAADVQADRLASAQQLARTYQCAGVLKGAGSVLFAYPTQGAGKSDTQTLKVCTDGNPGMATAGMGDVLSGVIAAQLAAQFASKELTSQESTTLESAADLSGNVFEALCFAVCLHSAAADLAARTTGFASLMASDVIEALGPVLSKQRAAQAGELRDEC